MVRSLILYTVFLLTGAVAAHSADIEIRGIEGVLTDAEGIPVPDREVSCIGITEDGDVERRTVSSDQNGAFTELWALPEGRYPQLLLGREIDGGVETTVIENVEIQYDGVVDLGVVQPTEHFQSLEEAAASLGIE